MGESLQHSLINPNQLRHFGTNVQDNPTHSDPMFIMSSDLSFNMELNMDGTTIFADTHTPS
jgi:hypothetical protein